MVTSYLQSRGKHAQIRPIVWVVWLFLGPVLASMSFHLYIFITVSVPAKRSQLQLCKLNCFFTHQTRCLVRTEAIFSQLILEHSLRIRMQDDDREDESSVAAEGPAIVIEDTNGVAHGQTVVEAINSGDAAIHPVETNGVADTDSHTKNGTETPSKDEKKKVGGNILGRINTLIATDIDNIIEAR